MWWHNTTSSLCLVSFDLMMHYYLFQPDRYKLGAVNQYDSWRWDVSSKSGIDLNARGKDADPRPEDSKPTEETEHKGSRGRSQLASNTALSQLTGKTVPWSGRGAPQGVPSLDYLTIDYHKDFSNMLGEMAIPRYFIVAVCSYTWGKWTTLLLIHCSFIDFVFSVLQVFLLQNLLL